MDDMAELFDSHEFFHFDGFGTTRAVYVVTSQIDEHDMFGAVFGGGGELGTEYFVLWEHVSRQ